MKQQNQLPAVETEKDLEQQMPSPEEMSADAAEEEVEVPLDKNVRLLSPSRMVLRRFFRSKLSVIGLVMLVSLFLFCWVGPMVYTAWGETEQDKGMVEYTQHVVTYEVDGKEYSFIQVVETPKPNNILARPSGEHFLGTDQQAMDVFTRLMYGGRVSLAVSFIAVFAVTIMGVMLGGISGYFGGKVDTVIMRLCDILMCLPGIPIMLIISKILDSAGIDLKYRIYYLMGYLTLFSWPGAARLVRGQILSLREQEYMVAAEAMGYSVPRKIFKHLVPNVMPQLIVSMTLSLGSMILYEASLSYLGLGVPDPHASWGGMIQVISKTPTLFHDHINIWAPPGICIIIAVLGFNFVGDGLRDALDPKMRR